MIKDFTDVTYMPGQANLTDMSGDIAPTRALYTIPFLDRGICKLK